MEDKIDVSPKKLIEKISLEYDYKEIERIFDLVLSKYDVMDGSSYLHVSEYRSMSRSTILYFQQHGWNVTEALNGYYFNNSDFNVLE